MSYQTFGAIAKSGFLLEPAGTTISISFNLKNYDLDFTKSGEVNFKVSSTALNPNTQWPLTIVISKSFYFDNSGNLYNKDINQNYIDENKSKSKEIDNISADLKFYSDSSYNNTIPFKLNY